MVWELPAAILAAAGVWFAAYRMGRRSVSRRDGLPPPDDCSRFFTMALDLFCIADTSGRFRKLNASWETTLGYSLEELEGSLFLDYVHPDDRDATRAAIATLEGQQEVLNFVNRYRCKDGSYRWIEWRSYPAGDLIHAAARDITASKAAEEALRESEERYRNLFEKSSSVMLVVDPVTAQIVHANAAACRYYGYSLEALTSLKATDINTLPREAVFGEMQRAAAEERLHFFFQHRLASGEIRHVEVFSGPIRFRGKDLLHSIVHDIEERKLVENALRASEEKYRTLAEQLGEGLVTLDREGRYRYCNRRVAEMLGHAQEELIGLSPLDIVMDHEREVTRRKLEERRQGHSDQYEVQLKRKDGTPLDCLISATPLFEEKGEYSGSLALFTDITERKRMEEAARQVQKSESLNLMASGIAHDFNNRFQTIQANLEMAQSSVDSPAKVKACLDRALRVLAESALLSRKMLDYSGRGFRQAVPVDLHDLLAPRLEDLKRFLPAGTRFEARLQEALPSVKGDPDQILQVVSGLLANAGEAIEGAGEIELAVAHEHLSEADLRRKHWVEPPPCQEVVSLSVTDSGPGIPFDDLGRIFDPFFTTKAAGRGLGLSATLGIVRNHKAGLQVMSSPKGTTFRISFAPVGLDETCDLPAGAGVVTASPTILLVDDDPDLREVVAESLHDLLGYEVLTARDGAEAVEAYRQNASRITLILMDAVMPRLSGGKAFDAIKQIRPEAKAILCSGYGDEVGMEAVARHGFLGFLKKPFSIRELAEAIERASGRP